MRHRATAIAMLAALTAALAAGCSLPAAEHEGPSGAADTLAPGDRVRIVVRDHADLSGTFELDLDGRIEMPLVGPVDAYGDSPDALADEIAAALADGYLRAPEVRVARAAPRPFFILGAVERPGSYTFRPGMTVADAIAAAGGVDGDAPTITVTPAGRERATRLAGRDEVLAPGDIVELVERAG